MRKHNIETDGNHAKHWGCPPEKREGPRRRCSDALAVLVANSLPLFLHLAQVSWSEEAMVTISGLGGGGDCIIGRGGRANNLHRIEGQEPGGSLPRWVADWPSNLRLPEATQQKLREPHRGRSLG